MSLPQINFMGKNRRLGQVFQSRSGEKGCVYHCATANIDFFFLKKSIPTINALI